MMQKSQTPIANHFCVSVDTHCGGVGGGAPWHRLPRLSHPIFQWVMSVTLHTSLGDLKIEIHCNLVPKTAENFLALCASGYYNGLKFHRNMPGFIIQGGDPTGVCCAWHADVHCCPMRHSAVLAPVATRAGTCIIL